MEHDPEWSRHQDVVPGTDFRDAIWLDGFDEQSVWGYDTGVESFFAQLWDNDSDSDEPDLWLTPPTFQATSPEALVPTIVAFTEAKRIDVLRALGIADPTSDAVGGAASR